MWLNGRLVTVISNGGVFAVHGDQTGRPLYLTDPNSHAIDWEAEGLPFDRNVSLNHWGAFNVGFPGQYWDAEDSLWQNGNRDYDPGLGRYIESDPIGLAGGVNTYAYVGNNPISNVDPLGLCSCHVSVTFTAVGPASQGQATGAGALYSQYPGQAGGSIQGGMGTVAVQVGFLGLTTRQLREYGTQISVTPDNDSLITQYGGPAGPLTVSDYGDSNVQGTPGVAMDIYRFPSNQVAYQFGRQEMGATINVPDGIGATCPQ